MGLGEWFEVSARELIAQDRRVARGRMLRSEGLRIGGKFFAAAADDELVLKLDADRVHGIVSSGHGRAFNSGGRLMKEWVYVRPASKAACRRYVKEALAFALR